MSRVRNNPLLLWSIIGFSGYWLVSTLAPGKFMSGFASLLLLIGGSMTLIGYAPETFRIVFRGLRNDDNPEGDGSHLSIYGGFLTSLGVTYVGVFGLLWILAGEPESWLSTAVSGFGRYVGGAGLLLLYISPSVNNKGVKLPDRFWLTVAAGIGIMLAFVLGLLMGTNSPHDAAALRIGLANCPPGTPIMGNVRGRKLTYHDLDSPYRAQTSAEFCFETVEQAKVAGFKPPG